MIGKIICGKTVAGKTKGGVAEFLRQKNGFYEKSYEKKLNDKI